MTRRGRVWQEGRPQGAKALRGEPWYFVVDVNAPGTKRKQVKRRGFPTQNAAQRALDKVLEEVRSDTWIEPSQQRFGEYLTTWHQGLGTKGHRPSTIDGYGRSIRGHVLDHDIAGRSLQRLTAADLDALYADLLKNGRRSGGGLSRRSVRLLHSVLSKALSDAERQGLIQKNPAKSASPPSARSSEPPEVQAWTPDELRSFLAAANGEIQLPPAKGRKPNREPSHHAALFRLAAMTGLRRGEVCGLRWSDVDMKNSAITVRHTLIVVGGEIVEGEPKTKRGLRRVDLDPATAAALKAHRKAQTETRLLVGAGYAADNATDGGFVFARPDGAPWNPDTVSQAFDRLLARYGLRRIRFHDLRHTHASHLLAAGVNIKVVSERLGHSSVSFTLDTYGHVMPGQQAEAAQAAAALVEG